MTPDKKQILDKNQIRSAVENLAKTMTARVTEPPPSWVLVGIHRRGVPLAARLARELQNLGAPTPPLGTLDITFYRDDTGESALDPLVQDTDLPFDVDGRTIFLVDDVLYTGRTVRSALDQLMDFGRPRRVYLVSLVDRGHRELPIQADFVGETVEASADHRVEVHLSEVDGEDAVWLAPSARSVK